MRLKPWLQTVLGSSLLAISGLVAHAQPPLEMAPGGAAPPWNPYGGVPPQAPGPPSNYQAWPEVSPYENSFSQTLNEGGLWTQNSNNQPKRYRLTVDYLHGRTRISDAFIGNQQAQSYISLLTPQLTTGTGGGGGGQNQQNPIVTAYGGNPSPIPGVAATQSHFELYGPLKLSNLNERNSVDGTKIQAGYDNADGSGFRFGFLYLANSTYQFNAREHVPRASTKGTEPALLNYLMQLPEDPADPNTVLPRDLSLLSQYIQPENIDRVLQNNLFNLKGLPLDDGTLQVLSDGTKFGGVTVPYDLQFKVDLRSELYGGSTDWMMTPVVDWGFLKVRPTAGLRYFYLREGFHFFGQDSGLAYTSTTGAGGGGATTLTPDMKIHSTPDGIDENRDGIVDNAGVFETGQQGGGGGGGNQNSSAVFLQFHDQFRYPISSFLDNGVESQLGGGTVGLNLELGGDALMLTSASRVGLLGNYERIQMNGDNIAMITRDSNLLLPSAADATPNSFKDSRTNAHVSTVFEQSFMAEAQLFQKLPVLRRVAILEKAQFRFGYTFMYIGGVIDPAASINWRGNPAAGLFPTIKYRRDNYTNESFNFGVSWQF